MAGRRWEVFGRRLRGRFGGGAVLLAVAAALGPGASAAGAVAPTVNVAWSSAVFSSTARLHAEVNPNDESTSYHFKYITKAAYDANPVDNKFNGASRIPAASNAFAGAGVTPVNVLQLLSSLQSDTVYRYRIEATNIDGTTIFPAGPDGFQTFVTFPGSSGALLPDGRGWELVSPVDKNGGQVDAPGMLAGGGVIQAAAQGSAITYGSAAAFGSGSVGAPSASQYIGSRAGANIFGWPTQNISVPLFSGSYDTETDGVPYRLFSGDLARGLLLSGKHCRGDDTGCPVANPPLGGTDAPAGYQNYYQREGGAFQALLGAGDVASLNTDPADFALNLAGTSPNVLHAVLSTCAPIAPGAADGCPADANLYKHSAGSLTLINGGTPGARLAASAGAVSADGSRIYWVDTNTGDLWLRDGGANEQVDGAAGGGGSFEVASADGSIAYFSKAGDLYRYNATGNSGVQLTSTGAIGALEGALGAASSGANLYFLTATGLYHCSNANSAGANGCDAASRVADDADASNHPAASGTARVSADGSKLLFLATTPLEDYAGNVFDNADLNTRTPDSQVYLYDTSGSRLTCVSCNPSNGRPVGPSSIPGATANGTSALATVAYKPRNLSSNGQRVYFDSEDALVLSDTNNDVDAYQWQAQGSGDCARAGGCINLISSGRAAGGSTFVDASADGSDAFFLTDESLVKDNAGNLLDPGSIDLYDARVGGGFAPANRPIPCTGDSCQVLPPEPIDPTLTTVLPGPGNPKNTIWRSYGVRSKKTCPRGKRVKTFKTKKGKKVQKCVKRARKKNRKRGGRR